MKRTAGLLLILILVLCTLLTVTVQADAENVVTMDGLELRLTTEKESYEKKEDIKITLEITNQNPYVG